MDQKEISKRRITWDKDTMPKRQTAEQAEKEAAEIRKKMAQMVQRSSERANKSQEVKGK